MEKSAVFTVCGRPNVGKSTLTNMLVGEKIAIVSEKPQTTRNRITGIVPFGGSQFVLLDTPGFHLPKTKLGSYMVEVVNDTVSDVDAVLLTVEPVSSAGPQELALIEKIKDRNLPAILVINKIDTVEKTRLLEVISVYSSLFDFSAVVPVSAKTGEGCEELLAEMDKFASEGPHLFPEDMITDQPERQICAELIREKLLRSLDKEIPHGTAVVIEKFSERDNGMIDIEAVIYCEKASHKGIVIGKNGSMIKHIGEEARKDIEEFLDTRVNLQTWVRVKENWRDSDFLLKNFGFTRD